MELTDLETRIADFKLAERDLSLRARSAQKRMEAEFSVLEECVKVNKQQQAELNSLKRSFNEIRKNSKQTDADVQQRLQRITDALEESTNSKTELKVQAAEGTGSLLVRFTLGRVNVKLWKRSDLTHFRDEYNKFKYRTTLLFIGFPLLQMFFISHPLLWTVHQLWLVYYYLSMSLRENILKLNGSTILSWWIYHHYICIVIGMIALLWPSPLLSDSKQYMAFGLGQGVIMLLQHRYNKKRLYVRRSLGAASERDVDSSETLTEKPTDLKILIPVLFALYVWEVVISLQFAYEFWASVNSESLYPSYTWISSLALSACFLALAVGNMWATGHILCNKTRVRRVQALKAAAALPAAKSRGPPVTPIKGERNNAVLAASPTFAAPVDASPAPGKKST